MTKRRFAKRLALAPIMAAILVAPAAVAQQVDPPPKAAKPIKAGEVLSGELNAMRVRDAKKGKRIASYQLTSDPRRLPPPSGLCNLETGPETFQLVTTSESQAAQLKEDLYSDLTGLIIRGVKRDAEDDVYDCIQTGRNGSK